MTFPVLDFFSGIGGFTRGLQLASPLFQTISFCEKDKFCRRVLRRNFPDIPIIEDINNFPKQIDSKQIDSKIFLICGGPPCQPISRSRNNDSSLKGASDDRWLWPQFINQIENFLPTWVLAENPPDLLNFKETESVIFRRLESLGYSVHAIILPAAAVGSPQFRERLYIVAYAHSERLQELDFAAIASQAINGQPSCGDDDTLPNWPSPPNKAPKEFEEPHLLNYPAEIVRHNLLGRDDTEWSLGLTADGVFGSMVRCQNRMILKAVGNSVVPQIIALFGRIFVTISK